MGQTGALVTVEHADSLVAKEVQGVSFRELLGNVRIRHDKVAIRCDRAVQNLSLNEVELIGNVIVLQDTLTFKSARGMYNGDRRTAWSSNGVFLNDGHTTLTADAGKYETGPRIARFTSRVTVDEPQARIQADALTYERDSARALAAGNVRVEFTGENAVVLSDTAEHFIERRISFFTGKPVLWRIDTNYLHPDTLAIAADSIRLDTTTVKARGMEARRDSSNAFIAYGDVEVVRGEMAARGQMVAFLRNDSLVILRNDPVLWYERTQATGDSIAVTLANGALRLLEILGNAFSLSESRPSEQDTTGPPGRFDQTKGRFIRMLFEDDAPRRITVDSTALSIYYLYDGRALNGVRRESGDRIVIDFVDGEADTIISVGGVEGTYYPEKYVTGRESSFNLEGFVLRTDRPLQPPHPDGAAR